MLILSFHPAARKDLQKLPAEDARRAIASTDELQKLSHPLQHPRVKKLRGEEEWYRLRVGDWRVKFVFYKPSHVRILRIENRQAGY